MSNLLKEAIVDAKALKEAALKNAEASIIEKYSTDIISDNFTFIGSKSDNIEEPTKTQSTSTDNNTENSAPQSDDMDVPF